MEKNKNKIWLFIAIIAIIGFVAVSCDDGETTPTAPTITTGSLPNGTVGTAYTATLAATGDTPITWSVATGTLPGGLTLAAATGVISGTPTAAGTSNFTVKATNSVNSATKPLSIVIAAGSSDPAQPQPGLYAKAPPITAADTRIASVAANDIAAAVTHVNAQAAGQFTLLINQDVSIAVSAARILSNNLTIIGIGAERKIQVTGTAATSRFISLSDSTPASLTLGDKITLIGTTAATSYLVYVPKDGTFTMEAGSKITGHNGGSPVYITGANSRFVMNGGEISGNTRTSTATDTAAVFLGTGSTFVMNGGKITGNTVGAEGSKRPADVFVYEEAGTVTLSGAAELGITVARANTTVHSGITLGSSFTGSATVNLQRTGTSVLATVIEGWNNRFIVKGAADYTPTAADLAKFTLGSFFGSSNSAVNEPIGNTHKLSLEADSGKDAIRLVTR